MVMGDPWPIIQCLAKVFGDRYPIVYLVGPRLDASESWGGREEWSVFSFNICLLTPSPTIPACWLATSYFIFIFYTYIHNEERLPSDKHLAWLSHHHKLKIGRKKEHDEWSDINYKRTSEIKQVVVGKHSLLPLGGKVGSTLKLVVKNLGHAGTLSVFHNAK
jgi:hypothetical protein